MPPRPRLAVTRPDQISNVQEVDLSFIRLCIYGDPGTGKTPLIGTAEKCLILDCDHGLESAKINGSTADFWPILDHDDLTDAMEYMRHEGTEYYDWLWVDSVTLFQERGLDQIMKNLVAEKPHRKEYAADKGEYGQNMMRIKIAFREMVAYPINFGWTAHVLRTEDRDGKVVYMPSVQGKGMPDTLTGYMNMVGRLAVEEDGTRALYVNKNETYYAKDRFGAVPGGRLLNPSIPKLERLVQGKVGTAAPARVNGSKKVAAKKAAPVKKAAKKAAR